MPLTKQPVVTVIPGDPGQPFRAASTVCTPAPPPDDSGQPPPPDPAPGERVFLHVPVDPTDPNEGTTVVDAPAPAPAGYTCTLGTALVPDPAFPGGFVPVYGMHCYWDYP